MTPFLQLRLWWKRAPYPNKVATSVAVIAVVAVIAWGVNPTGSDEKPSFSP